MIEIEFPNFINTNDEIKSCTAYHNKKLNVVQLIGL